MQGIATILLDIDGVLTVSWRPLPGAVEAVTQLRDAGLTVALVVRTGKYRPKTLRSAPGRPDHVIDSVADLPRLLGRAG